MTHEDQPTDPPADGGPEQQPGGNPSPWDPNERVGDIYEVDIGPDGLRHVEKLHERGPQIWVGSLSDYNNGVLYGQWLDAARDPEDIHRDIHSLLAGSPTAAESGEIAEEWGIFDYEGFGATRIDEHESIDYVAKVARGIAEHGLAYAAWADVMEDEELLGGFQDAYRGHFGSVEAYVEQLVDDLGYDELLDRVVPESLRPYVQINVAAMAKDMQLSGDLHAVAAEPDGVWIFDGHI
jgi:antirestriction protein